MNLKYIHSYSLPLPFQYFSSGFHSLHYSSTYSLALWFSLVAHEELVKDMDILAPFSEGLI